MHVRSFHNLPQSSHPNGTDPILLSAPAHMLDLVRLDTLTPSDLAPLTINSTGRRMYQPLARNHFTTAPESESPITLPKTLDDSSASVVDIIK